VDLRNRLIQIFAVLGQYGLRSILVTRLKVPATRANGRSRADPKMVAGAVLLFDRPVHIGPRHTYRVAQFKVEWIKGQFEARSISKIRLAISLLIELNVKPCRPIAAVVGHIGLGE